MRLRFLPGFLPSLPSNPPAFRPGAAQTIRTSASPFLTTLLLPHQVSVHPQLQRNIPYRSPTSRTKRTCQATMTDEVVHDPGANRYEMRVEGVVEPAFLKYNIQDSAEGKVYNLTHTYVDPAMRGKGVAAKLVRKAISHAREDNHKIIPTCSYIVAYMQKHEDDRDVVYKQ